MLEKENEVDNIATMFEEATAGIREGLTDIVKAHIAKILGGEFSIAELAQKVFNNKSSYGSQPGEKWIDGCINRAVERNVEEIVNELLIEQREELVNQVREAIASQDIAGKIAEKVVRYVDRSSY